MRPLRHGALGAPAVRARNTVLLACLLAAGGCATPIGVERADPQEVHRELTANVLSTGELSGFTQNILRLHGVAEMAGRDPEAARSVLHDRFIAGTAGSDTLFALAELSFKHAEDSGGAPFHVASAVYSYTYLFPEEDADAAVTPFDPRFRWAVDLYNRSLSRTLEGLEPGRVQPQAGSHALPFGRLDVSFDPEELVWGDRLLSEFSVAGDLTVRGLRNRYREPGLGAPLAAASIPLQPTPGFQVAPRIRVPVTAVLRIAEPRESLERGELHGVLELFPPLQARTVTIAGREVPLESEPTVSLAYGLADPGIWATELRGFIFGDLLRDRPSNLVAIQPHQPGRFPVVFVHGTASSAGRWADLVNDLLSNPAIRDRFEFWFFSYETGNPIPYSALQLRQALTEAVAQLDPQGNDPALREMIVIGHSQGGLLAKMTAIDPGPRLWDGISAQPLDTLRLQPETRELLRQAVFIEPVPAVRRVVFIATPHRGSHLAELTLGRLVARLVRLPVNLLQATGDIITNNPDALRLDPERRSFGSIYGMNPRSPFLTALAEIPLAPGVAGHSIIAVRGTGPIENGTDGVVRFESARLPGMESELIVRSGHSVQGHPETVLEVRRILIEHARQACRQHGIGCTAPPALASGQRPQP
jgi:pimeloyl-ACP methyl ester carboxylesterase